MWYDSAIMNRKPYESDLTDEQWNIVEPMFPPANTRGRPRADMREVLNAVIYATRSGCQWRMLPHDLPPWPTVHKYFKKWTRDGTLERIHDALRDKVRESEGRDASPSAAIIDSQSVKTTQKRGFAGMTRARK